MKPSMQEIWMQTAIMLSKRSECSKSQVGCIITTNDMRHVLGNGYNGYAKGVDYICEKESCNCLHAENNALIDAGSQFKDKVVFVTMFPCLSCMIQIINSGCSKLYYKDTYKELSKHWLNYPKIVEIIRESKIEVCQINSF